MSGRVGNQRFNGRGIDAMSISAVWIDTGNLCTCMSSTKDGGHSPEVIMSIIPMHN